MITYCTHLGKEIPIHVIDYVEDKVEEILRVGIKQDALINDTL